MKELRGATKWLGAAAIASAISCVEMAPYRPFQLVTGEDSDALYAATIRVLVHKGWGVMSADRGQREVRTRWFRFRDIGLGGGDLGRDYGGSFRVTVKGDGIEVFTVCDWMNEFDRLSKLQACPDGERPEGLHDREVELVSAILDEARAAGRIAPAASARAASNAPPASPAPVIVPPAAPAVNVAPAVAPPMALAVAPPIGPAVVPVMTPVVAVSSPAPSPAPSAPASPDSSAAVAPPGSASAPPAAGCSTDNECKGDRICINHECVDAPHAEQAQGTSPW